MMRRLKIAQRSMLAFGLIGLITLVLGMTGIVQFERIGLVVETLSRVRMPAAITVGELRRDFLLTRLYTMNALYADSTQAREAAMARLAELEQNFQADLQEMKDFVESEDGIRLLQAIVDQKAAYDVQQRQLQAYMNQGQMDMARQFRHQGVNE